MFDDRLTLLREKMGKTRKEVAAALDMPYTTYLNYETNAREPNSDGLIKIADFFGVSADYLLGRTELNGKQKINPKILNAKIESASFGYDGHGILSFDLSLQGSGWGVAFGGYALDSYDETLKKRVCKTVGLECLTKIIKTVGVKKWEDLKGQYCRIIDDGWGKPVNIIGHIIDDKWFDVRKFFEKYRKSISDEAEIKGSE